MTGPAPALLLLAALLAAGARADHVTTAECEALMTRVRHYPTDSAATDLLIYSCGLTEINSDILTGLSNIETIYLHENKLENIYPAVFRGVPKLTKLDLDRNKLRELPVFDQNSCTNLKELKLSFNQITGIYNAGTFSACAKLERLDLNYNDIGFIHFKVFSPLTELRVLYLNNNRIRFIPDQMLASNSKLVVLFLNNNGITYLPADFASSLWGAGGWGFVNFKFIYNPWHCACVLELLADVQRAGVSDYQRSIYDYNYDGVQPVCNYISMREYPCSKIRELNFIAHGVH